MKPPGPFTTQDPTGLGPIKMKRNWGWLLALGGLWLIGGLIALAAPAITAFALNIVLGVVFLVAGGAQVIHAAFCREWGGVGWHLAGGALSTLLGALLLAYPGVAIVSLALVLGLFFLFAGTMRATFALANRDMQGWPWGLASGVLAGAVGVLILLGWPAVSAWAIGVLIGVDLTFSGIALIMTALAARRQAPA